MLNMSTNNLPSNQLIHSFKKKMICQFLRQFKIKCQLFKILFSKKISSYMSIVWICCYFLEFSSQKRDTVTFYERNDYIRLYFEQRSNMQSTILNEQLIQDMFQQEFSKEIIQIQPQQVSLNFTVSSRESKNQRKDNFEMQKSQHKDPLEIVNLAQSELAKFNQCLLDSDTKLQQNYDTISTLLSELQRSTSQCPTEEDLSIIKSQIFKRQAQCLRCQNCKGCANLLQQVDELKQMLQQSEKQILKYRKEIDITRNNLIMKELKEEMLSKVEINLLNLQLNQLNSEITILRSQKANLEKTYLFNKTRNSQIQLKMQLQKSKGLSAAKNSTNSSELMNRNHETIVFIDPIESDVDEWIRFFDNQKNRYMYLCKKEENQKIKQLGRSFTKDEKNHLHLEGRFFVIYSSIKEIWKNLNRIRENTNSFLNSDTSKNVLKQKFTNNNDSDIGMMKFQNDKFMLKNSKLVKVNQYLSRQNANLKEITEQLKKELLKINYLRNQKQQQSSQLLFRVQELNYKILEYEEEIKLLGKTLEDKQQQIDYCLQQIKKYKKLNENKKNQGITELQVKNKEIQKKYYDTNNQIKNKDIKIRSLQLKLKKQTLERKRYYNDLQETKGSFRIYCRIRPKFNQQKSDSIFLKSIQDRIFLQEDRNVKFDKIFQKDENSQQKVFGDIKMLVQSVLDGYNLCILCYGQSGSGKSYTLLGSQENPGIFPRFYRQIFKSIEQQKQYMSVECQITCVELYYDKIKDIFNLSKENNKTIEIHEDQMGNISLVNANCIAIQSAANLDEVYQKCLLKRQQISKLKGRNGAKSHFIISIMLSIQNKKSQQKYRSRINFVQLASPQKLMNGEGSIHKESAFISKSLNSLQTSLVSLSSKQNYIPYRQNKLTYILKNTLNPQSKVVFIANVSPCQNNKEQSIGTIMYSGRLRGLERNKKQMDRQEILKKRSISRISNI